MKELKTNVMRLLEAASVPFHGYEYPVDDGAIDGKSIARKIGRSEDEVFKTLVTMAEPGEYFVFVIPVACELDLKRAAKAAHRKHIALIPMAKLLPLTGYVHGGCSPVGMKKFFPTWIDETAILCDTICVSGGRVGVNLAVNPEALAQYLPAEFAPLAADEKNS